jgi:hypothetical protein
VTSGRVRPALVAILPLLGGCFSYTAAVTDRPVPAHVVELTLNDRGRIAMESHIGTDVLTIEGAVASVADSSFVMNVQRLTTIGGSFQSWAGEPVTFRLEYVRGIRERKFSVGRTALLVGSATAAAFALVSSPLSGVFGGGNGPSGGDGGTNSH